MNIVLIGMKACGKTTVGKILAKGLALHFIELDEESQKLHQEKKKEKLSVRGIFKKYGKDYFRNLETETLAKSLLRGDPKYEVPRGSSDGGTKRGKELASESHFILASGGGTPIKKENQEILKKLGIIIYLQVDKETLYKRIIKGGFPAFFDSKKPKESFEKILKERVPIYQKLAKIVIKCNHKTPAQIAEEILTTSEVKKKEILMRLKKVKTTKVSPVAKNLHLGGERDITGQTKIIGFFGSTYKQSNIYSIYNTAFKALNLNYVYVPFVVKDLKKAVEAIRHLGIKAAGITIPYKIEIIKYLDKLEKSAKEAGSVNVVVNKNGLLYGANTDGQGCLWALKEKVKTVKDKKVVLLGAGGAARSIAYSLKNAGAKLVILNRSVKKAKDLAQKNDILPAPSDGAGLVSSVAASSPPMERRSFRRQKNKAQYGSLKDIHKHQDCHILINATSVGMMPVVNKSLVPPSFFKKEMVVQDIVNKPARTKMLKDAKKKGCIVIFGNRMLLLQAVLKFKYYTDIKPTTKIIKIMEKALLSLRA